MAKSKIIKKINYLNEMNIAVWQKSDHLKNRNLTNVGWRDLEKLVKNCKKCALYKTRLNPVFGIGSKTTNLMIIGEAPGMQEDLQGVPFVGRAGKLLESMLGAIEIAKDSVYIANILKSRPPNNRNPLPEEMEKCIPYLYRQIKLLKPKLILALGLVATKALLKKDCPMHEFRANNSNHFITVDNLKIRLISTYHPAYLLRAPKEKDKAWEDLKYLKKLLVELDTKTESKV